MTKEADLKARKYNLIEAVANDIFEIGDDKDISDLKTIAMVLHDLNGCMEIDKIEWYMKWRENRDVSSSPQKD